MLKRQILLAVGAVLSLFTALIAGQMLLDGQNIDTPVILTTTYIVYALALIAMAHCGIFAISYWFEVPLSKRLPKYLDYAYIILVAFGLFEILGFGPRYYAYLIDTGPGEIPLLENISATATAQLRENCGKAPQHAVAAGVVTFTEFSADYCRKLAVLTHSTGHRELVLRAANDQAFMHYVIERDVTTTQTGTSYVTEIGNPIAGPIGRVARLDAFKAYSTTKISDVWFKWMSLLLLPLGIAFRTLKTSLELFGNLV
jgi:hypothetical protein